MLIEIPAVLDRNDLARAREILAGADWGDGRATAGSQSALVKNNDQIPEGSPALEAMRCLVMPALARNALFFAAALPRRIFPPLVNRYAGTRNAFGNHVDNAIRDLPGNAGQLRTDVSCTLFLSDPADYEGGELVIEDTYGSHAVKLAAGDAIVYPSSSLHRVEPVRRGERLAGFFWIESLVREPERRRLLFDLDLAVANLRQSDGDTAPVVKLTACYHNLLRMWAAG